LKLVYKRSDIVKGLLVYSIGDSIAAILLGEFLFTRVIGILLVGATIYAFEIPNYFNWIENKTKNYKKHKKALVKTLLALLYFNPLWIFRHLVIIKIFSLQSEFSFKNLLIISSFSFLVNIPISFFGNFIIQNKIRSSNQHPS